MPRKMQMRAVVALAMVLLLASCSSASSAVGKVLDARDAAISHRDITAYAKLIADDYKEGRQTKANVVDNMKKLFGEFSQVHMHSFGRDIYVTDSKHAQASQSYRLKVLMDGTWREMLQREELTLVRNDKGWQIESGL